MTIIFDGPNKLISLSIGTTTLGLTDLWSRAIDWWLTSDNSKYIFPLKSVGGDDIDISAGTRIPFYFYLQNGWKIRPQESNHTLNIINGILLVDGGGDPFVNTIGSYVVRINYSQPVQAITVSTGGGSGGIADWTNIEKEQIRNRLGIDGDTSFPTAIPTLALKSDIRNELSPELAHILTIENNPGMSPTQATMLLELFQMMGLDPTKPLVVNTTHRSVGPGITQTIQSNDSQTIITRI